MINFKGIDAEYREAQVGCILKTFPRSTPLCYDIPEFDRMNATHISWRIHRFVQSKQ